MTYRIHPPLTMTSTSREVLHTRQMTLAGECSWNGGARSVIAECFSKRGIESLEKNRRCAAGCDMLAYFAITLCLRNCSLSTPYAIGFTERLYRFCARACCATMRTEGENTDLSRQAPLDGLFKNGTIRCAFFTRHVGALSLQTDFIKNDGGRGRCLSTLLAGVCGRPCRNHG